MAKLRTLPACRALISHRDGAVAVEMALMLPTMLALIFVCMEAGYYLYTEHQIIKGVRDGARYAGRQSFSSLSCTQAPSAALVTAIKNVTVYGKVSPTSTDTPRISTWTVPDTAGQSTTTITMTCAAAGAVSGSGSYTGIYTVLGGAPVVKVSASVQYPSLFKQLTSFGTAKLIGASDQAAVMGV